MQVEVNNELDKDLDKDLFGTDEDADLGSFYISLQESLEWLEKALNIYIDDGNKYNTLSIYFHKEIVDDERYSSDFVKAVKEFTEYIKNFNKEVVLPDYFKYIIKEDLKIYKEQIKKYRRTKKKRIKYELLKIRDRLQYNIARLKLLN